MSPEEVTDVLADLDCAWWVAGGWALDLHLGRQTRAHADVDVLVLRDDLSKVNVTEVGLALRSPTARRLIWLAARR